MSKLSEVNSIFPEEVAERLQVMGYRGMIDHEGRPSVHTAASGYNFAIYFYEAVDGDPNNGFAAYMFDLGVRTSRFSNYAQLAELCGRFNYEHRYVKAFLSGPIGNQAVVLQMDSRVNVRPLDAFNEAFDFFLFALRKFDEAIIRSDAYVGDQLHIKHTNAINCLWGSERNPEEAVQLYREAAQEGYAGSQNNLGDLYETGKFIAKSQSYAIYWYTRSAERGEPTAYFSLATLLSELADDEFMIIDAAKFAILAIEGLPEGVNKTTAQKCFADIQKVLTEHQFCQAEDLARNWKPLFQETRLMSDKPDQIDLDNGAALVLH